MFNYWLMLVFKNIIQARHNLFLQCSKYNIENIEPRLFWTNVDIINYDQYISGINFYVV